jgi:hypothetical protein
MTHDNEASIETPTTRPRETFSTFPVGSAASPRTACSTTSSGKRHIEASI